MSKFANLLKVLGIVGAIVVLGVLIGWLASKRSAPAPLPIPGPAEVPTAMAPVEPAPRGFPVTNRIRPPTKRAAANLPGAAATVASGNVLTNWEDTIDEILGSQEEDSFKARQMLQIFPRLPTTDAQVEVAQHISNLTPDEEFTNLAQYATNSALPDDVLEVFLDDVLNRPNSVKLPTLLDIASNGQHPKAADAKELLELFLEEDYGTDWAKWRTKMQEWLQENPD